MQSMMTPLFVVALAAAAQAQAPTPMPAPAPAQAPTTGVTPMAPPVMRTTAPGLAGYTDEVLFGEVWKRPFLSPRDRSLVTIAALIATGRTQQLTGHAGRGLDNGVTPAEISGTLTHLAFYAGWPAAVSALPVVDEVFKQRGIDRAALQWPKDGLLPVPASEPARAALVGSLVAPTAPALAELTGRVLFDDLWRRPDLAPRDRSLVTIAALVATGAADQLPFHIRRGLENRLTRDQLAEAITHLAFYAGWPRAMAAVPVLAQVTAETAAAAPRPAPEAPLTVIRRGAQSRQGPAETFVGRVTVDTPFSGTDGARVSGATVRFEAGARTAWHTHPLGQTLVVTEGHAWVQREGHPVEEAGPGDVVWIPPNVKHWHGATRQEGMTHIAISERQDGQSVTWMEQLDDADYASIRRIHE